MAEITRAVGQGGRQLGRLRRAGQPVPRAVRKARRPRPTRRGAANGQRKSSRRSRWRRYWRIPRPHLGHLLPISALLAELSRRGHTVHVRTLSTGVEIGQRLGFTADAIDPRIEEIEHDDWKATNPVAALKRSVAVFDAPRRARSRRSRRCGSARSPGRFARGCELLGCAVGGRGRSLSRGRAFRRTRRRCDRPVCHRLGLALNRCRVC